MVIILIIGPSGIEIPLTSPPTVEALLIIGPSGIEIWYYMLGCKRVGLLIIGPSGIEI